MQANSVNFLRDILENGRYFYIPVYQRNYSWQDEQCKQLMKDIMMLYNGEYADHFIGTVVWKPDDGNTDNLSVIDGQQRLTTMFLLILAMRDNAVDQEMASELNRIVQARLSKRIRLTPIKSDNEVFTEIVAGRVSNIKRKSNRIYANYYYFDKHIKENGIDIEKLYDSIGKLSAIKMELHQNDNPQVIFESINSTGMSLSIADLIRNFLLMNEDYETQTRLFEDYWYEFENKLGVNKLVAFFEHYLSIYVSDKVINRTNMYAHFKKYFVDNDYTAETLLVHLVPYIDAYSYLCDGDSLVLESFSSRSYIDKLRDDILELENTTAYMFLMPTLLHFKDGEITEENLVYSFELVLSYIFRRGVVGLGTNVLAGTFRRLYKQATDNAKKYGWKNALDYALITSKANSTAYFPTNEVFYDSLHSRNLYGKFKYTKYLLLNLENEGNKTKFDSESFTIEHVMPQTATQYWRDILGKNWKEIHEENVNDLGNLTLTSYNSELSNSSFEAKKQILTDERHIKLNEYFYELERWNNDDIIERGKHLAKLAVSLWKFPDIDESINNKVQDDRYNSISLGDLVEDYFSIKPVQIVIENQIFKGVSIRDGYENILKYCIQKDSDLLDRTFVDSEDFTRNSNIGKYYIISKDENQVYNPKEILGYFYDKNRSGRKLYEQMNEILQVYDVDTSEVIIKYYK